ncbi:hypothetical protein YC2023_113520 [Brassica napus]
MMHDSSSGNDDSSSLDDDSSSGDNDSSSERWFDEDIQHLSQIIRKTTTQLDSNSTKAYSDNKRRLLTQERKHKRSFWRVDEATKVCDGPGPVI